jgi:hypothetical protein
MALICKDRFTTTCLNEIYHVHGFTEIYHVHGFTEIYHVHGFTVSLSKHVVKRDKTIQVHI